MTDALSTTSPEPARRFLAVWFPFLPTDRIMRRMIGGARDKSPLVVVEKVRGATRLVALSQAARTAGLDVGLSLADARVRFTDLWVEEADPAADRALLEAIAEKCDRFSPVVMLDRPDGLLLDITGCADLFGGEAALSRDLSRFMRRCGLQARTTIAGAPDAARALARYGPGGTVPPGGDSEAVRSLPVAALGLPEHDRVAISRAGLKTIGSLADRSSLLLSARFGEGASLRLRRLQGAAPAPLTPVRVPPRLWVDRRFPEPLISMEAVEKVLAELVFEACAELSARREGGRAFDAAFYRADGAVSRVVIESGRPLREPLAAMRLFRERLETLADPLDPGFGFDLIRLSLLRTEPLASVQTDLDGRAGEAEAVTHLADRLATRFGAGRVLRFEPENSHDPVRAVRCVAYTEEAESRIEWPLPATDEPPLRPLHMFQLPQPITAVMAEVPDGPPRQFTWRRRRRDIVRAEGPERISPEWWRGAASAPARDYYRVEDAEGFRFWLCREGRYGEEPRWFVHGLFA